MTQFTPDNTQDYTDAQLEQLNAEWCAIMAAEGLTEDDHEWKHRQEQLLRDFDRRHPPRDPLNFHSNGDVFRQDRLGNETLIGRIDSDGDWRPEEGCPWTEDEVRAELASQIDELGDSYRWPIEQLSFADII